MLADYGDKQGTLLVRSSEGTDHINWSRVSNTLTVAWSWHLVDIVELVRATTRSYVYVHVPTTKRVFW